MRGGHWLLDAHLCQVRGAAGARGPGVLPAGSAGTVAPKNHHRVIGTVLASVAPPPAPARVRCLQKPRRGRALQGARPKCGQNSEGGINKTPGTGGWEVQAGGRRTRTDEGRGELLAQRPPEHGHGVPAPPGCCHRCLSSSLIHKVEPGAGRSAPLFVFFLPDQAILFATDNLISQGTGRQPSLRRKLKLPGQAPRR